MRYALAASFADRARPRCPGPRARQGASSAPTGSPTQRPAASFKPPADGTYEKYGLDVTIVPGGPQANGGLLILFGKLDFFMGGDMIGNFLSAESKLPLIAVAADFQKSPQILMSHPGVGLDQVGRPAQRQTRLPRRRRNQHVLRLARLAYGFKDENVRPYNFNSAPFIANAKSIQQGYATAEPFEIERQGRFKPNVFLLADHGYSTYSTLIVTRNEIVEKRPDLVQRFVDASAIGWYHYLYGDSAKGNALIKTSNPDITDEQIAFSIRTLKERGIVDSGDALTLGIGAMTDARWKDFFDKMVEIGMVDAKTDYRKAYTLEFVNKGVGLDLRPKVSWKRGGVLTPPRFTSGRDLVDRGLVDLVDRGAERLVELGLAHRALEPFGQRAREARDHAMVVGEPRARVGPRVAARERHDAQDPLVLDQRGIEIGDVRDGQLEHHLPPGWTGVEAAWPARRAGFFRRPPCRAP